MKHIGKICLSLALVICCLIGIAVNAQAATTVQSGKCGKNLTWTLDDEGVLTISGDGNMVDYSYYNKLWYNYRDDIKSVVIESGVTNIGASAFSGCVNMTEISIPGTVTDIGSSAFSGCNGLTEITIPNGVITIGDGAFGNCDNLVTVRIPASVEVIGETPFHYCSLLTNIVVDPNNTCFSSDSSGVLFNKDKTLLVEAPGLSGAYTIPDGVEVIGKSAFFGNEMLTSVSIPGSVVRIGDFSFAGCSQLTSVIIPEGVQVIETCAFQACYGLTNVSIPDSIVSIGAGAIESRSGVQYNTYSNAKYLGNESNPYVVLVGATSKDITSCEIYSKTKIIEGNAFSGCVNLESITIPESVINIHGAFNGCDSLQYTVFDNAKYLGSANNPYYALIGCTTDDFTSYNIHEDTKLIGASAFYNCDNLTDICIPNGVVTIGSQAFASCDKLSAITIPEGVSLIDDYAFNNCGALKKVFFTGNAPTIAYRIFYRGALTAYYPANNDTWSDAMQDNYGGTVTWAAHIPMIITTRPVDKTVKAGTTAEFTVVASGDGLGYQWQYRTSSDDIWKDAAATGNKTATLSVPGTVSRDGYQYRCRVQDSQGHEIYTNAVTLNVMGINTQPVNKTVKDGAIAKFTVAATGTGLKYQWQYRKSAGDSWKTAKADGNTTATLSVPASVSRNGYQYRCRVSDNAGNKVYTDAVTLYVLGIKTQPVNKTVVEKKTAKFTVSATGTGLKYQWQYRKSSTDSWKAAKADGNKTETLSVSATAEKHGYQYRCRVTDNAGNSVYTKTVSLYVLGIKTQPASKTVKVGATAKFTVTAVGKGLTFQWQYRTSEKGSWKNASATGSKTKTLSVPGTKSRNGYQYRCKITDSKGNVIYTNTVKLTVK